MGYYRGDCNYAAGDYYRGDYYQGDFLGIGKALKKVGGVLYNTVVPAPIRAAVGAVRAAVVPSRNLLPGVQLTHDLTQSQLVQTGVHDLAAIGAGLEMGGTPGVSLTPSGVLVPCQMKGYRQNKSGYYRHPRGNPAAAVYVPPKSVCVKSRRLNVANPRALRRAIRRAQGFAKLARRVMTFVSAKAPKGRAKFKKKR